MKFLNNAGFQRWWNCDTSRPDETAMVRYVLVENAGEGLHVSH